MKKFPKFLKALPEFYGLSFYEIGALVLALYLAMIFRLSSMPTLICCLTCIGAMKFLKKNFDFVGFFLPYCKKIDLGSFHRGQK